MKVTKQVSLNSDKSLGYGHLLPCCGKYQPVHIEEMDDGDVWHCADCDKPLMFKHHGRFYCIGEDITI